MFGFSRQAFFQYQKNEQKQALQAELIVQEVLQHRALQKRIGGRKLFFMMQRFMAQHSINIGRDSFFDTLRDSGLLIRIRKRKAITTNSNHWFRRYPNLIKGFIAIAPNQLWVCDITYICVGKGFAYLSLITDAYSRKIVGFYLSIDLSASGTIKALLMALKAKSDTKNLIHHSDRGVQYCCNDYVQLLNKNGIKISMTENGDPLENAMAERVNGILKSELLEDVFATFDMAQQAVALAVSVYNHHRPHSCISNYTPQEAHQLKDVELKRLWKNYYKPQRKEAQMNCV